jgi:hypothetical protein
LFSLYSLSRSASSSSHIKGILVSTVFGLGSLGCVSGVSAVMDPGCISTLVSSAFLRRSFSLGVKFSSPEVTLPGVCGGKVGHAKRFKDNVTVCNCYGSTMLVCFFVSVCFVICCWVMIGL